MDIQQALYDFDATINSTPDLTEEQLFEKFPEFGNDPKKLQAAYDYSATLNSGEYNAPEEFNHKFPELFTVKKKEDGEQSSPESEAGSQSPSPSESGDKPVTTGVPEVKPTPTPEKPKVTYGDIEAVLQQTRDAEKKYTTLSGKTKFIGDSFDRASGNESLIQRMDAEAKAEAKRTLDALSLRKDAILKENSKAVKRPVDKLIEEGTYKDFFNEDGVFDYDKATKHFDAVVAKYGGGTFLREMWIADLKNRGQFEIDKPQFTKFYNEELKASGIDMSKYGKDLFSRLAAPKINDLQLIKANASKEASVELEKSKQLTTQKVEAFNTYVTGLNEQIKSGQISNEQGLGLYNDAKKAFDEDVNKISASYKTAVVGINNKVKSRYSRIDSELKKLGGTINNDKVWESIPEKDKEKIQAAQNKAAQRLDNIKNAITRGKDMAAGMTNGGLFGKAFVSGWNKGLGNIGDYLIANGFDNGFSQWLRGSLTTAETFNTAQYEMNSEDWINRTITSTGQSLGASAPIMLPTIAISFATGGGAAGAIGSAAISYLGDTAQNAGEAFRSKTESTGDSVKGAAYSDKIAQANEKNIPFYFIGGIGEQMLLKAGSTTKAIVGRVLEQAEEVPTSYSQAYSEAALNGYDKGFWTFAKEHPEILFDTVITTALQSEGMAVVGHSVETLLSRSPESKRQYLADMISKHGTEFANKVLDKHFENGIITETQLAEQKAQVSKLSSDLNKLQEVGVNGDDAKVYTILSLQVEDLKNKISKERNEGVKAILNKQLSALTSDINGLVDNTTPYIAFNHIGGDGATVVMTESQFNALDEAKQNDLIKSSDGAIVKNNDELQKKLNDKKAELGYPAGTPAGAVKNGIPSGKEVSIIDRVSIDKPAITTNTTEEANRIKSLEAGAEDGATINLDGTKYTGGGLVVPVASMNTTQEELTPEMIAQFAEQHQNKLSDNQSFKLGLYKFPNSNQVSIDLNIVTDPKNKAAALEFARKAGQESLFDLGSFENVKTGADGSRPMSFNDNQFAVIGKALAEGKVPDVFTDEKFANEAIDKAGKGKDIDAKIEKVKQAYEASGLKVEVVENNAEMNKRLGETDGQKSYGGLFLDKDGTILLNKEALENSNISDRIIYHEGSHPVLNIIRNTNEDLYNKVLAGLKEAAASNTEVAKTLAWAQKNYSEDGAGVIDDESIVETIAKIADGTLDLSSLPTSFKQAVIDFINKIAEAVGLSTISDTDVAAFKKVASQISDMLKNGTNVEEIVGEGNATKYENNIATESGSIETGSTVYSGQTRIGSAIENPYKQSVNLPARSLESLLEEYGDNVIIINSDPTGLGTVTLPNGEKVNIDGGIGYMAIEQNIKDGVGFAASSDNRVKSFNRIANELNNAGKLKDGKVLVLVMVQKPDSILGNSYTPLYVADALSKIPSKISDKKLAEMLTAPLRLSSVTGKDGVMVSKDPAKAKEIIESVINEIKSINFRTEKGHDAFVDATHKLNFAVAQSYFGNILGSYTNKTTNYNKEISKMLYDYAKADQKDLLNRLGEKSLVDRMIANPDDWGYAVAAFVHDTAKQGEELGGIKHSLFNSKFQGDERFILEKAYKVNDIMKDFNIEQANKVIRGEKKGAVLAEQQTSQGMYASGKAETEGARTANFESLKTLANRYQARKTNLVEEAGVEKEMTEDGKGNYVFYHYSDKNIKSIDPNKFGSNTRATGKDEKTGVGISMYYTRPDRIESNVPNDFGYAVRVPMEKVYPFNADPLNLIDKAEKEFRKQYGPDAAFDLNKQIGFVTKVAGSLGYKMTVAEWNIGKRKALRAQTTESIKPEKYSNIKAGTLNQVEYNPELENLKANGSKKKAQARVEDNEEPVEKDRGLSKTYSGRNPETIARISNDAKTYFAISNKQTTEEVNKFMEGKSPEEVTDYLLTEPQDIAGRVRIWMSGAVMDGLDKAIAEAEENKDDKTVARLAEKQAQLINQVAPLGTELGQAIQAFRRFYQNNAGSPALFNHFFNNLVSKIEKQANRDLTKQERDAIKEIAKEVQDAPEGLPKDEAVYKLGNYVGKIVPVSATDIFQAIWYAHILSGVTTQTTNFFANFWNTFAEGFVTGFRESIKSKSLMPMLLGMKGFVDGIRIGATEAADIFLTGVSQQDANKFVNKDLLEYFSWKNTKFGKLGGGKVGSLMDKAGSWSPAVLKYVGRALAATDAAFARSNEEAMARMMAFTQAKEEGAKDTMKRVREILFNTKENIIAAQEKAKSEGYVENTRRYKRRVYEIMEQKRGAEFNQKASEYGTRVTLNYEPEGFTRPLYNAAVALQNSSKFAKLFIPFTRIVANLTENSLNYTPAGYIKAVAGSTNSEGGRRKLTKDERADMAIKATIGLASFIALAGMTGSDDDDLFDVTANGTADMQKNYELRKSGWRPYSIKLKSGRYISYKDWPIMPILAAIGAMHDADKYEKDAKEVSNHAKIALWGMANAVYDKSVMTGIQDFVEMFKPSAEYNQNSKFGDRVVSWGADQASTMVMSNFTKQVIKFVQEGMDSPVKSAKGVQRIYRDIPFLNDGLNPIIDVFGEPITQTTSEKLLPVTLKRVSKDEMLSVINENGIFIGKPQTRDIILDDETGESRPMTDQEYYEYTKEAGKLTKQYLQEEWSDVQDALKIKDPKEKQQELQAIINAIVKAARLDAMDMFYDEYGDVKPPKQK